MHRVDANLLVSGSPVQPPNPLWGLFGVHFPGGFRKLNRNRSGEVGRGGWQLEDLVKQVTAEVMLKIEVLKGHTTDWPRLETETHILVAGSTRPLMNCVRLAQMELLNWLVKEYGFQREEVWQLSGQVGSMRIGNVVDPCYTVVARFPKRYLP